MKEKDIQKACIDLLEIYGFLVLRINSGMIGVADKRRKRGRRMIRMAPAGTSDIIACSPKGQYVAIEIKRPGNKPTELQMNFLEEVDNRGGLAMWVDDPQWLKDWLDTNNYKSFVI